MKAAFSPGSYSVGYQSCDHSSAGSESPFLFTTTTCRRNARALAAARNVLGVIGPFNSTCAAEQIPIFNGARGGPLAQISASATAVGLTHAGPGTLPGEPRSYYPRGVRNFARVVAADDVQGAADAVMAKRLGVKELYVLDTGDSYGVGLAASVRQTARKIGVGIAGSGRWDPQERGYRRLARRIENSGADGVFLGGILPDNGATLVRDLRAVLGPRLHILASDGFEDFEQLIEEAGRAAEGMVVSVMVVPNAHLPPSGRRFVAGFERAIAGPASPYAATTAQATEVLLEAIAASDGTRASVTRNLLRTRVRRGILGSFEFDETATRPPAE
jgi:branched-chain amino acid transport system substrate-binding protein